jgi:nitrous oxidase accessory protein NosD
MNIASILGGFGVWFGVAAIADAATITVSKNGPITSIQVAVDQAVAGDTILVKSGVYQETVKVLSGKDGLTLKGVGTVVIDGRGFGGVGVGAALTLVSNDMTVRGFTIRNAAQSGLAEGDGVLVAGARARLEKCTIVGCEDDGIDLRAVDAVVKNCTIRETEFGIKLLNSDRASFTKCLIERTAANAVFIDSSADVVLDKLTIDGNRNNSAIRTKNSVPSDGCVVLACVFRNLGDRAIDLEGVGTRVEKCKFQSGRCTVILEGDGVVFRKNLMLESLDNEDGLALVSSNGALIEGNRFENVGDVSVRLLNDTTNAIVIGNVVIGGGFEHEPAFSIEGTGHTINKCRVLRAGGDAFELRGDALTFVDCNALDCLGDGFDVDDGADGNTLNACVALGSLHEGIDNTGAGTLLVGCVAKKNRIDVASDGTFAQFDVAFTSGGQNTPPELD